MKEPKRQTDEFASFSRLLSKVVRVPGSEVKAKIEAEKRAKKRRGKRSSARASGGTSRENAD